MIVNSKDLLVVSCPGAITEVKVVQIKERLKNVFPDNEVLVLADGLKLEVMQREQLTR